MQYMPPSEQSSVYIRTALWAVLSFGVISILIPFEILYYFFEVQPFQPGYRRPDFFELVIIVPSLVAAMASLILFLLPIKLFQKLYSVLAITVLNTLLVYLLVPYIQEEILFYGVSLFSMALPLFYLIGSAVGQGLYVLINRVIPRFYLSFTSKTGLHKTLLFTFLISCAIALFFLSLIVIRQVKTFSNIENRLLKCHQREEHSLAPDLCFQRILDGYGDKFEVDLCRKIGGGNYTLCFYTLAAARKDPSLCYDSQYPQRLVGGGCYEQIVRLAGDSPLETCGRLSAVEKDKCFKEVATSGYIMAKDPREDAEKKLTICNLISDSVQKGLCYQQIALFALRHISREHALQICGQITENSQRDACSTWIGGL